MNGAWGNTAPEGKMERLLRLLPRVSEWHEGGEAGASPYGYGLEVTRSPRGRMERLLRLLPRVSELKAAKQALHPTDTAWR